MAAAGYGGLSKVAGAGRSGWDLRGWDSQCDGVNMDVGFVQGLVP